MKFYLVSGKDFLQNHYKIFKELPQVDALFKSKKAAQKLVKTLGTISKGGPCTITTIIIL